MESEQHNFLPTKKSLLGRLRNWRDDSSWREFFDTYWRLIYNTAVKSGLSDAEAQEVVQETIISVAKHIPEFQYDPQKGTFKGWMLTMTKWRIKDQIKKRHASPGQLASLSAKQEGEDPIEQIPDPHVALPGEVWDDLWEANLLEAAIERVKQKVDPKHYQVFDLYVLQNWPVKRIALALRLSAPRIYLIKHRISRWVKKEYETLQKATPEIPKQPRDFEI